MSDSGISVDTASGSSSAGGAPVINAQALSKLGQVGVNPQGINIKTLCFQPPAFMFYESSVTLCVCSPLQILNSCTLNFSFLSVCN